MPYYYGDWTPPPDPDRPKCPYLKGFVIQATEHEPPIPSGYGYPKREGGHPRGPSEEEIFRGLPQTRHVLEYPPQETKWPPHRDPPRLAKLTITETIRTGQDCGPQLVVCQVRINGDKKPHTAVAKIYDSLYYSARDSDMGVPVWVGLKADREYSHEVKAYRHLQTTKVRQEEGFAPKYYGSWSFDLELTQHDGPKKRSVRMILIEHICGPSLQDLRIEEEDGSENAYHYDESYRLDIMAKVIKGYMRQIHSGLDHRDIAPRNIMLVPGPSVPGPRRATRSQSVPRVVLVDYGIALVKAMPRWPEAKDQQGEVDSRPRNPAKFLWEYGFELDGWHPREWNHSETGLIAFQKWIWKTFGENTKDFLPMEKEEFG